MSASLVGPEMCIRDSFAASASSFERSRIVSCASSRGAAPEALGALHFSAVGGLPHPPPAS
eukprot:5355858-Alexandrium_andersonii.AAC.1